MIEYKLYVENKFDRHCGFYETYGISVFRDGERIRSLSDVSVDREKVERLVAIFNSEQLEPVHLNITVEDFLYDMEI